MKINKNRTVQKMLIEKLSSMNKIIEYKMKIYKIKMIYK